MNRFVYLINNRTGCKVRCVNPVFQYKLGLLIKKLKKYKNELKQNKISKELLLKIRKTLNETLSLLGINNKSSKLLSRSSTDYCDLVEDALVLLIIILNRIYRCINSGIEPKCQTLEPPYISVDDAINRLKNRLNII